MQQNVVNSNFEGKPTQRFVNVLTKRHLEVLGGLPIARRQKWTFLEAEVMLLCGGCLI